MRLFFSTLNALIKSLYFENVCLGMKNHSTVGDIMIASAYFQNKKADDFFLKKTTQ